MELFRRQTAETLHRSEQRQGKRAASRRPTVRRRQSRRRCPCQRSGARSTCRSSRSRSTRRLENDTRTARGVDRDHLLALTHQVHLDALLGAVPDRAMRERREIEVPLQLAVDPYQQVLVERGGDAERIVVGEHQLALRLDADPRRAASDRPARARGECAAGTRRAAGVSKLPMFDPRKQHEHGTACVARRRCAAKPVLVRRLMADDGDVLPAREPAARSASSACDEMSIRWTRAEPPRACSASASERELLAAAAPQLDDRRARLARCAPNAACSTTSAACRSSSRRSARVMRYQGSRQIASNRLEPSAS